MLVLSRHGGEKVYIGDDIVITVVDVTTLNKVRLGIAAPTDVAVHREEVYMGDRDPNAEKRKAIKRREHEIARKLAGDSLRKMRYSSVLAMPLVAMLSDEQKAALEWTLVTYFGEKP